MKLKMLAMLIVLALLMSIATACGEPAVGSNATNDPSANNANMATDAPVNPVGPIEVPEQLVIVDSEWDGVDMYQCDSWNDMQCLYADSILNKADDGTALPGIASNSVWSDDGLTWTLTFPEGMYYSTGEQLEPEDVVASIEHGLECSSYADGYQYIESMEISGRDVIFHLSQFQADMEFNFMQCFVGVIDKDELDSMTNEELLWGCHPYGPYYVEEYSQELMLFSRPILAIPLITPSLKIKGRVLCRPFVLSWAVRTLLIIPAFAAVNMMCSLTHMRIILKISKPIRI